MKILKYKYANVRMLLNKIMMLLIMSMSTTSCAIYKSSFNCGEARGARCLSMDIVDVMIDSGEIEKYHKSRCQRGKCYGKEEGIPELRSYSNNTIETNEFDRKNPVKDVVVIKEGK